MVKAVSEALKTRPVHQVLYELSFQTHNNYDEEKVYYKKWFGMKETPDVEKVNSEEDRSDEHEEQEETP